MSSPEDYVMGSISYETAKALAQKGPCYITNLKGATSDVYYIPANATADTGSNANYSTATLFFYQDDEGVVDLLLLGESKANPPSKKVTSIKTTAPAGDWQYLQSSNRSAYPDSGIQDGYEYEYLGIPFDNAVTAPKIETGSYVGTGTYNSASPNTLTFGFVPQLVFLFMAPSPRFAVAANGQSVFRSDTAETSSIGYTNVKWDGNTMSWYNRTNADEQLNKNGQTYHYIAIG